MGQSTMGSGLKMVCVRAKEPKSGRMVANTSATGRMTRRTVKVVSYMRMETSLKVTGTMIKPMVAVFMNTWTAQNISVIGKKIDNTDMASNPGQTRLNMKATMSMARSMELVPSSGLTDPPTSANSTTIIFMEKESISGPMNANTKVNGEQTKCMAKERSLGVTEESTSESTLTI